MANTSDLDGALSTVCSRFTISCLNPYQKKAISEFVKGKSDIFVNLPTGYGKSLVYQALPTVFDSLTARSGHIVVFVSPLVNLMRDQVRSLRSIGISSVSLSDLQEGEAEKVEKAAYSVVFGTPESWLKVESWRQVLSSPIYSEKLCCVAVDEAHVIKQW